MVAPEPSQDANLIFLVTFSSPATAPYGIVRPMYGSAPMAPKVADLQASLSDVSLLF